MIRYFTDKDLFHDNADALTNPVNCKGVMGNGLAFQFRQRFPDIVVPYQVACTNGTLRPGRPLYLPGTTTRPGIVFFPTKNHWRGKSRIEWIDNGLKYVADHSRAWGIESIAMPQLGCGLGGLEWSDVSHCIESHLADSDLTVNVYTR